MIMTEKRFTVKELCSYLLDLIEEGHGGKTVRLSVNYDHCDHVQNLRDIHCFDTLDWITLTGGKI